MNFRKLSKYIYSGAIVMDWKMQANIIFQKMQNIKHFRKWQPLQDDKSTNLFTDKANDDACFEKWVLNEMKMTERFLKQFNKTESAKI